MVLFWFDVSGRLCIASEARNVPTQAPIQHIDAKEPPLKTTATANRGICNSTNTYIVYNRFLPGVANKLDAF